MKQVRIEIPRVDALEKVLGEAKFRADLSTPESLHLKAVRSPKPHARIVKIEIEEALKVKGLQGVFTAKDIPGRDLIGTITKDQPVPASDRVRCIGDPVVLVVAQTEEGAEEAARKVAVVYEEFRFVSHLGEGPKPYAPLIHEKGNLLYLRIGRSDYRLDSEG